MNNVIVTRIFPPRLVGGGWPEFDSCPDANQGRVSGNAENYWTLAAFEIEPGKNRFQGIRPLGVTDGVGMQQIGEFVLFAFAVLVGVNAPRVAPDALRIALHNFIHQRIELFDLVGRPVLLFAARHHFADDDRHPGVESLQVQENGLDVVRHVLRARRSARCH